MQFCSELSDKGLIEPFSEINKIQVKNTFSKSLFVPSSVTYEYSSQIKMTVKVNGSISSDAKVTWKKNGKKISSSDRYHLNQV